MSNKVRLKKITKTKVKVDYHESVKHLIERQDAFIRASEAKLKEVIDKHNQLASQLQAYEKLLEGIVTRVTSTIGEQQAHLQMLGGECDRSLRAMDMNILALAEITKELVGSFEQVDVFLKRLATGTGTSLELTEAEIETLKTEAEKRHKNLISNAFDIVREQLVENEKKRAEQEAAVLRAKEEAEKSAKEKEEADRVGQELRKAEEMDKALFVPPGGSGSGTPEGAQVFGGDYGG